MSNIQPRFYAACLASYNNGVLYGKWIEATNDADEMMLEISEMLRGSKFPNVLVEHEGKKVPSAEEWAMHDSEYLPSKFGEYPSLKDIASYMDHFEECSDRGLEDIADEIFDNDLTAENYAGSGDSEVKFCEEYLFETGFFRELKEGQDSVFARYFDFESYWNGAMRHSMTTIRHNGTVYVFYDN